MTEVIRTDNTNVIANACKKIAELEKENAELKETVTKMNNVITETFSKLTKAKELLKEFVHHYKAKTIYIENMQDLLEQSDQFLSEVEK